MKTCLILRSSAGPRHTYAGDVGRLFRLTAPRQFDILQSGPGWRGPNAIRSTETARVHHTARRRGRVAARGARAAGGEVADHRVPGLDHAHNPWPMGRRLCAAVARTRLDRGS